MEAREFVTETLKQLIDGVHGVQKHARKSGAAVNPRRLGVIQDKSVQEIDFDMGVTVTEGKKRE